MHDGTIGDIGLTSTALARRLTAAVSPDWLCDQARRGRLVAVKRGRTWAFAEIAVRQAASLLRAREGRGTR